LSSHFLDLAALDLRVAVAAPLTAPLLSPFDPGTVPVSSSLPRHSFAVHAPFCNQFHA